MNLLLCVVNDILDLKLIEEERFEPRKLIFSPGAVFKAVKDLFANYASMQGTKITFDESAVLPPALGVDQLLHMN